MKGDEFGKVKICIQQSQKQLSEDMAADRDAKVKAPPDPTAMQTEAGETPWAPLKRKSTKHADLVSWLDADLECWLNALELKALYSSSFQLFHWYFQFFQ